MPDAVDFFARHSAAVIFLYVFAEQIGLPIPAVPMLLAMGAFAAAGKADLTVGLLLSVVASTAADSIWYVLGRARGARVLRLLCKISLEPDSCVRRTEDAFVRYGVRSLVVAKFVPGWSTVAPPLAGIVGVGVVRFVGYSIAAAFVWAGAWAGAGYLAGDALRHVVDASGQLARVVAAAVVVAIVAYVAFKWVQRRRFLRRLRIARVGPAEVKQLLEGGAPVMLLDLRSPLDVAATPYVIPGALRIAPEELERRHQDIPRDRDIVVYCS